MRGKAINTVRQCAFQNIRLVKDILHKCIDPCIAPVGDHGIQVDSVIVFQCLVGCSDFRNNVLLNRIREVMQKRLVASRSWIASQRA